MTLKIGDLVHVHSSYNHVDDNVKYTSIYLDISNTYEQLKVTPPRPRFLVPLKTPGILLEIVNLDSKNKVDFKWAKVMFPQGVGYVSFALLRKV